MRRVLVAIIAVCALLCGCVLPRGTPEPGYDTYWYRAFPTPTPTPSPTPSPVPSVTPAPTPAPLTAETDAFTLILPYPYVERQMQEGLVWETEDGRQIWYFALDVSTAKAALSLPLPLLSSAVAKQLDDSAELALTESRDTVLSGRPATLLVGSGTYGERALLLHAYAVMDADVCHVFILSWPAEAEAEETLTAILKALIWK